MDNEERKRLLEEFLKGNDDPEAEKLFDAWFRKMELNPEREMDKQELQAATDRIAARLRRSREPMRPEKPVVRIRRIAAIAASVILAVTLFWQTRENGLLYDLVHPPRMTEYLTAAGETKALVLPDGTRAYLNQHSSLTLDDRFAKNGRRDVYITGEAFFEAAKDKSNPFLVHANQGVVKVLGTKFNVSADPAQAGVMVVVQEGMVSLRADRSPEYKAARMGAGEGAMLQRDGSLKVYRGRELSNYLAWQTGQLAFSDEAMSDVVGQLQQIYHTAIRFDAGVDSRQRLTLSYKYAPLPEVLAVICEAMGWKYTQHDPKEITITKK